MWYFRQFKGGKVRDPLTEDFFDDDELLTDASSLVREAIQNSLDAGVDEDQPVTVRFKMGVMTDSSQVARYFSALGSHLEVVVGDRYSTLGDKCKYLVIEDFNTEGLRGDTNVTEPDPTADKSDFNYSYFIHHEGAGNKGDGKRGRWGVGKVVFTMISAINAFFAYSVRTSDFSPCGKDPIFIGQCTLKHHHVGEAFFEPDGWFAGSRDALDTALPFQGESARAMSKDWNISRDSEPGLSLVVPFIKDEVGIDQIRDAVIRQYFLPIMADELVCEIVDESGNVIVMNSDNLVAIIDQISELTAGSSRDLTSVQVKSAIKAFRVAQGAEVEAIHWKIRDGDTPVSKLSVPPDVLEALADSLSKHGVGLVVADIVVPVEGSLEMVSDTFEILFSADSGETNPVIFSREGILVPGRTSNIRDYASVVLMDAGPLANLLSLAEGPAHESWEKGTRKFKEAFSSSAKIKTLAERCILLGRN